MYNTNLVHLLVVTIQWIFKLNGATIKIRASYQFYQGNASFLNLANTGQNKYRTVSSKTGVPNIVYRRNPYLQNQYPRFQLSAVYRGPKKNWKIKK
jgi:hypothetical protein